MKKGDVMLYAGSLVGNFHVEIADLAPNEDGMVTVRRLYDGEAVWVHPRALYERLAAREEAMKTEWRKQDGYHEEHQLVEMPADRIIGVVGGSVYRPFDGWHARTERADDTVRLGRFTTAAAAKRAVEEWWAAASAREL